MPSNPSYRRSFPRFALVVLAAAALTLFAALRLNRDSTPAAATTAASATRMDLAWSACDSGAAGWQCATLTVPVDYARPDGATIEVALTRLPASDPARRIGPLLINFGGPGAPAVESLHGAGTILFSDEMRARFDLVGFDPRGVGLSAPLDCRIDLAAYFAVDPSPDTAVERQAQAEAARRFAAGCGANGGPLLAQLGTDNVVRDVERLRVALGVDQISFWGPSYGTSIAVQYIEQYPSRVRAFSIEDVLANDLDGTTFVKDVAVGLEQSFAAFLAYCAATPDCPLAAGGDPGVVFDALMTRLDQAPLVATGDPRLVGQGDILELVYSGVSTRSSWPELAETLAAAVAGDATTLRTIVDAVRGRQPDGAYAGANALYANLAVTCIDQSVPRTQAAYETLIAETMALAPRTGAYYLSLGMPCVFWPVPSRPLPASPSGRGAPPLLVVGGTTDPQTPYIWAQRLARQLPSSTLLTREGSGHTSYLHSRCVQRAVDAYLLDLVLPAPGTVCDSTGGLLSGR